MLDKQRRTSAAFLVSAALAALGLAGCGQPTDPLLPPPGSGTQLTTLDVDGHSLAYGVGAQKDGPNGTGLATGVAQALGLKLENRSFSGATLQETGLKTDGWGKVLDSLPRTPQPGKKAVEALPHMALLYYGPNDMVQLGPNLSRAEEAYRVIIARHRASAVYEAGDPSNPSIHPDAAWSPVATGKGEASGDSVLQATRPGSIKIDVAKDTIAEGAVVDLGFTQPTDTSAQYTIMVDGKRQGTLRTQPPLKPLKTGYILEDNAVPYVYRIEGLSPEDHTIEVVADSVDGEARFDYWQVEPPNPEPVVLAEQYRLPTPKEPLPGNAYEVTPGDIERLNQITRSLAAEFGPRVIAVDVENVVNGSPGMISIDGIHLSQQGHDAVALAIADAIRRAPFANELPVKAR